MIGAIGIALSALTSATKKAEEAATNIATAPADFVEKTGTIVSDTIDISEEAVNLMMAETEFKANAAVIRAVSDMQDELIDKIV